MSADTDSDPKVIAWRIAELEKRLSAEVATLHTKFDAMIIKLDAFREATQKAQCPAPGMCVRLERDIESLTAVVDREQTLAAERDKDIQMLKDAITSARASVKTAIFITGVAGSAFGGLASLLFQTLTAR